VPKELFEEWAKRDPVERYRAWLRNNAELSDEEEEEIGAGVKRLLSEAMRRAEESPMPDPATLLDGVFATPEELDTPHHK
jgi:pyruvate dehydrogenase E1 component alpha subunit